MHAFLVLGPLGRDSEFVLFNGSLQGSFKGFGKVTISGLSTHSLFFAAGGPSSGAKTSGEANTKANLKN